MSEQWKMEVIKTVEKKRKAINVSVTPERYSEPESPIKNKGKKSLPKPVRYAITHCVEWGEKEAKKGE